MPPGAPRDPQRGPKSYFGILGSILEPNLGSFWDPAGDQKLPQNRFFAKKEAPKQAFKAICVASAVFLNFRFGFGSILEQKKKIFLYCCSASRVFF